MIELDPLQDLAAWHRLPEQPAALDAADLDAARLGVMASQPRARATWMPPRSRPRWMSCPSSIARTSAWLSPTRISFRAGHGRRRKERHMLIVNGLFVWDSQALTNSVKVTINCY